MNDALTGLQHGTYVAPSKQTVRDFLVVWIDTIKPEVALTEWTNYGEVVERYAFVWRGGWRGSVGGEHIAERRGARA